MTTTTELPNLDNQYEVNAHKVAYYREHGHVLLRQVATSDEAATYLPCITDALEANRKEHRPLEERDTYHKAFVQVGNIWEGSPDARKFVFAERFAKIAADLMGVEGVRLYHDQALFKEAGGGPTPWHQDQFYWPFQESQTITMWMALVPAPAETGALIFASGSQKEGPVAQIHISDESARFFSDWVAENDPLLAASELAAGDATFHGGWTLHKAPGNSTDNLRAAMTIIYFADGMKIAEPANDYQPADLERWFPGQKPGEVAGGPLTPLLWHKDANKLAAARAAWPAEFEAYQKSQ